MRQHLTALNLFTLGPTQQYTYVVARLAFVQQLTEHLHTRTCRLCRVLDADNLNLFAHLHNAALNSTCHHRAATRKSRTHPQSASKMADLHVNAPVSECNCIHLSLPASSTDGIPISRYRLLSALSAEPVIIGVLSPGNSYVESNKFTYFHSPPVPAILHHQPCLPLFRYTTMYGTPTCRASRMCSRVCGIGPSAALQPPIAPSICAAPVIMFFT